jgi:hypothetical protein
MAAAAVNTETGSEAEANDEAEADDDDDALFEELRSCRRLLTNAEKLWLLNNGRLPTPQQLLRHNAALLGTPAADDYGNGEESDSDSAALEGSGDEQLSDDENDWVVLPPDDGNEAAAAAAGGGGALGWLEDAERQFTKQQVSCVVHKYGVENSRNMRCTSCGVDASGSSRAWGRCLLLLHSCQWR